MEESKSREERNVVVKDTYTGADELSILCDRWLRNVHWLLRVYWIGESGRLKEVYELVPVFRECGWERNEQYELMTSYQWKLQRNRKGIYRRYILIFAVVYEYDISVVIWRTIKQSHWEHIHTHRGERHTDVRVSDGDHLNPDLNGLFLFDGGSFLKGGRDWDWHIDRFSTALMI